MELDVAVEAQQTDDNCVEMPTRVKRGTAEAFFHNEHHAVFGRTPCGNQLVLPKSFGERVLTLGHHATGVVHPGMNCWNVMLNAAVSPSAVKSKIQETRY